jgi:CO/xanthine dehydrogenase FAD-binding subunit
MRAFEYVSPTTKLEAVHVLDPRWGTTEVIAGGSDLLELMKAHVVTPKRLVNIKNITELRGMTMTKNGLRVGGWPILPRIEMCRSTMPPWLRAL